jgi:hypothetical protein
MQPEIIALLFPEPSKILAGSAMLVTALMRDSQGAMEVRELKPDKDMMRMAQMTGRFNIGKPIVDPATKEVIGYEIEPFTVAAV